MKRKSDPSLCLWATAAAGSENASCASGLARMLFKARDSELLQLHALLRYPLDQPKEVV